MSIVVTGAAGFIGRHVVAGLRRRGHAVVGIDRRHWRPAPGEAALVADLTSPSPADDALRDADGVIHLAGRPGVRDPHPHADRLRWRDNVVAGRRVLALVPPATPMVVASSSSVYGGARRDGASREDDRLAPRGGYARSKVALERACGRRAMGGGHVGVVRPFTVAGPGQRPDMAISRWLAAVRDGHPLVVYGHPGRTRDVTDVAHVAEGMIRMLEREVDATVNLGTGRPVTLATLAATVAATLGVRADLRHRAADRAEVVATRADTARCRQRLGFVPSTDLSGLVARQAAALRDVALAAG